MRAVVLQAGEVRLENEYPEPALRDGEVRVRVLEAGICETDLQLLAGYMDYHGVLGHEFVQTFVIGIQNLGFIALREELADHRHPDRGHHGQNMKARTKTLRLLDGNRNGLLPGRLMIKIYCDQNILVHVHSPCQAVPSASSLRLRRR